MADNRDKEPEMLNDAVYKELEALERTLNSRPPATPAIARIFARTVEKAVGQYLALPEFWRKKRPYDTDTLLEKVQARYDSLR